MYYNLRSPLHLSRLSRIMFFMATPLGIDHDKVRAVYIATGSLKEAANAFGIKETTVRQWCRREGWESTTNAKKLIHKAEQMIEVKRENNHRDVVPVCNVSDVLSDHIENNKKAFVTNMASGLNKASRAISDMDDLSTLENSRRIVDLATAGKVVFGLGSDEQGAKLQLNVLQLSAEAFMPHSGSVMIADAQSK